MISGLIPLPGREGPEQPEAAAGRRPAVVLEGAAGPEVELDGRRVIYLGGTNYFGMSTNPAVLDALREAIPRWGLSPGGGRTTSGTSSPHLELEAALAGMLEAGTTIVSATGYQACTIVLEALRQNFDVCLADELSHSSIRAASAASGLPLATFRHRDPDDLLRRAKKEIGASRRPVVATDGVFPTSGVLAPLVEYHRIARELKVALLVDDAHGIGVLGEHGLGLPEHLDVPHADILYTGSLSKAFGAFGGFAAGPPELAERVVRSGAYVGATPLPPALCAAARRSVEIVCGDAELRRRLRENTRTVKESLHDLGIRFPTTPMPIAQFVVGDARRGRAIHAELRRRGVLIPFNTYPGGPAEGYFRLAVSAAHTREQLRAAMDVLGKVL